MAYAQVQTKEVHVAAVAGTTMAVAMTSAYTPGNLAQVWAHDGDNTHNTDFPTCADDRSAGNTYSEVAACRINDATNNNKATGHYAKNLAGAGAPTVTLTWVNSNTFRSITVTEFSGLDTAAPLIAGISNKQTGLVSGTDNIVSGNINFTAQPAVLCGYSRDDGAGGVAPGRGTGFSDGGSVTDAAGVFYRWQHKRITATGNAQATFNSGATSDFNTMAMGLLEAASSSQSPLASAAPRMISRQRVGFNAIPRASNLYQPAAPVDNTPQPTGATNISPLAQARPKAIIRGRFAKAPVLEHVRPAVATAAPQAFVAQLTAATFTFTPQDTTRLNAYLAQLSSAVFQFTANALTRLTTVVSSLSSAVFTFTPQALTRLTTVVNVLSSAVFTFTPQTLRQMVSYVASLSAAAFQFTAQALTRVNAYAAQLSAATFQFVGRAVSYTVTGGATIVSDWLQRARRRRR
jgi:hypothetical protein